MDDHLRDDRGATGDGFDETVGHAGAQRHTTFRSGGGADRGVDGATELGGQLDVQHGGAVVGDGVPQPAVGGLLLDVSGV